MPVSDIVVNGEPIQVLKYFSNSLSEEACAEYGLDSAEMDIVHTNLSTLGWDIVSLDTYGLVYYVPTKLVLPRERVSAFTGLRLRQYPGSTEIETVVYDNTFAKIG